MTTTVQALYGNHGQYIGSSYEQKIVGWLAEHRRPSYAEEINALQATYDETIGDAGRYWQYCEFTRDTLNKINNAIREVFQAATDRYEDWASD
jgi:hypothetical protein